MILLCYFFFEVGVESSQDYPFNLSNWPDNDPPSCHLYVSYAGRKKKTYEGPTGRPRFGLGSVVRPPIVQSAVAMRVI